jgi:hypothetical protein
MNDAITALPLNLCPFKDICVLLYGNMMNIMRQTNNSNFKKYPAYQFIPYFSGVSTGVSTINKMVQWCIHLFRGMSDEKNLVYKGGWF